MTHYGSVTQTEMSLTQICILFLTFLHLSEACHPFKQDSSGNLKCEEFLLKWLQNAKIHQDTFTVFILDSEANRKELCWPASFLKGSCGWWVTILFKYITSNSGEKYLAQKGQEYCAKYSEPSNCTRNLEQYMEKMRRLGQQFKNKKLAEKYCAKNFSF